jgi:ribonuclease G
MLLTKLKQCFVIDVNSGRSVSEAQQEKTSYKTNLEAAKEIARQIRLRDFGGMIIVDFIDMISPDNQKKLFMFLKKEMRRDRARTTIYPLTKLGLMQLTRQRINQNISEKMSQKCPMCNGTGRIASKAVLMNSIEIWLKKFRVKSREFKLIIEVHPMSASYFTEALFLKLIFMLKYFQKLNSENDRMNIKQFRLIPFSKIEILQTNSLIIVNNNWSCFLAYASCMKVKMFLSSAAKNFNFVLE